MEIADLPDGGLAIRNSREPAVVLVFTVGEREAFIKGIRDGSLVV